MGEKLIKKIYIKWEKYDVGHYGLCVTFYVKQKEETENSLFFSLMHKNLEESIQKISNTIYVERGWN